jgi:hypothetical protein
VTVAEVQEAIRLTGVLAIWQLGGNVPDAIFLDMLHEQRRPQQNSVNVE